MVLIVSYGLGFAGLSPQVRSESTVMSAVTIDRLAEIEKAIDAAWRARQPAGEMVWSLARTPYFASERWPTPSTTWTSYLAAYGTSVKDGLRDGQHVAEPWARITYDNGARTFALILIGDRLVDSRQIQGVRPLAAPDVALLKREPEFRQWVLTHPQWPVFNAELRGLQQFYATWMASNGVLAGLIAPRHEDFIKNWVSVIVG